MPKRLKKLLPIVPEGQQCCDRGDLDITKCGEGYDATCRNCGKRVALSAEDN